MHGFSFLYREFLLHRLNASPLVFLLDVSSQILGPIPSEIRKLLHSAPAASRVKQQHSRLFSAKLAFWTLFPDRQHASQHDSDTNTHEIRHIPAGELSKVFLLFAILLFDAGKACYGLETHG
jgi:hypothetical protein